MTKPGNGSYILNAAEADAPRTFKRWWKTGPPPTDKSGRRYGRLTPLRIANERSGDQVWWECRCDCGKVVVVRTKVLRNGNGGTKSCGCLKVINRRVTKTHGMSGSRTYRIFFGMKARCENPNAPHYAYYGGSGVTVCPRWHRFEEFLEDMGECPNGLSLDRIDSAGPYAPDNCRWATREQQGRNRRSVKLTERQVAEIKRALGEGKPQSEIARDYAVRAHVIWAIKREKSWKSVRPADPSR